MINPEVEAHCTNIRKAFECGTIPIDPKVIAEKEELILAPGTYGEDFDGRIEFLRPERRFVIYYQEDYAHVADVRVRFSLAHELGHFYLDSHRERLCAGEAHDSEQGLISDKKREREADDFAASLLIPRGELRRRIGSKGFMDMQQILGMAKDLRVSVPASAIRYFGNAEEKCAVIMSEGGLVKCHLPSDSMREIGLGYMKFGASLPPDSKAMHLFQTGSYREVEGAETSTNEWYPHRLNPLPLYEDSFSLGYGGRVITLLSVWKVD